MAAPVYEGSSSGYFSTASTSHSISLPSGVVSGDLLLCVAVYGFGSCGSSGPPGMSGWTAIEGGTVEGVSGGTEFTAKWRIATGAETSATITLPCNETLSYVVFRFSGAEYATKASTLSGPSTAPDVGSPSAPTTSEDFYQLAITAWSTFKYQTAYPTGYSTGQTESNNSGSSPSPGQGAAGALKLVSSVEDPGAWTLSGSTYWLAAVYTIISDGSSGTDALAADGIDVDVTVGSPTIGQDHQFDSDGIGVDVTVGSPTLSQEQVLEGDGIDVDVTVGSPSLSHIHNLAADGIDVDVTVGSPTVGQVHALSADSIDIDVTVGSPSMAGTHELSADSIDIDVTVGSPTIGQVHELGADSIDVDVTVGSPNLTALASVDMLYADGIDIDVTVAESDIGQVHELGADSLDIALQVQAPLAHAFPVGGGGKHTKCCCPVQITCDIASDDFNRADSSSLGSLWREVSGDFEISSNTLVTVTPGIVLTTARQGMPIDSSYYTYVITFKVVPTASSWKIICKFTDTNNFDWVEIWDSDGFGTYKPKFWRRTGGSDALILDPADYPDGGTWSIDPVDGLTFTICYSSLEWSIGAALGSFNWVVCDADPATSLPPAPDGFVGFMDGDFDDFQYDVHWESNHACEDCTCYCWDGADVSCLPENLTLTLYPTEQDENCPTATNIELQMAQSLPRTFPVPSYEYEHYPMKLDWFSEPITMTDWNGDVVWFHLRCIGYGIFHLASYIFNTGAAGGSPFMTPWIGWTNYDGMDGLGMANTGLTCDPLVITWDEMTVLLREVGSGSPPPHSCIPFYAYRYNAVITATP